VNTQLPLDAQALHLADRLRFISASHAPRSLSAYASDWRVFNAWCEKESRTALPAVSDTVECYITHLLRSGRKVTTIRRHLTSIIRYHRLADHQSPVTYDTWSMLRGARRLLCEQPLQKQPMSIESLIALMNLGGTGTKAARDRAVILFGFASALRRINLTRLQLADVTFSGRGMLISVRGEKQDREGVGRTIAIPRGVREGTCALRAALAWVKIRGDAPGPLFQGITQGGKPSGKALHPQRVAIIVKDAMQRLGFDPDLYGAHSLRAGFVTSALEMGINEVMIAKQTGHRSLASLKLYMRSRDPFLGNAFAALGL
jgi:site-specific recombinase XerD